MESSLRENFPERREVKPAGSCTGTCFVVIKGLGLYRKGAWLLIGGKGPSKPAARRLKR